MSLQYVIDGCNIINHRLFKPKNRSSKDKRAELAGFISSGSLCGSPSNKITIVFDGFPSEAYAASRQKDISVIFSEEKSADDVIKKLVEKSASPKNIKVVSDDKEVALFARFCGASSVGVEEFINRGKKVRKTEAYLPSSEPKVELNQAQVYRINSELERLWLK